MLWLIRAGTHATVVEFPKGQSSARKTQPEFGHEGQVIAACCCATHAQVHGVLAASKSSDGDFEKKAFKFWATHEGYRLIFQHVCYMNWQTPKQHSEYPVNPPAGYRHLMDLLSIPGLLWVVANKRLRVFLRSREIKDRQTFIGRKPFKMSTVNYYVLEFTLLETNKASGLRTVPPHFLCAA